MAAPAVRDLPLQPFHSVFDKPHGPVRHRFSGRGHKLLNRILQPVHGVLKIL
jgi:hypothetical protein